MKKVIPILSVAAVLLLGASIAFAMGLLNLPPDPVAATQTWLGAAGTDGTVDTTLSGVPDGYDVMDGTYVGWCTEDNHQPNAPAGTLVTLYDSTTDPAGWTCSYPGVPWDKVNYLLNNQAGTVAEVQAAFWHVAGTQDDTNPTFPLTAAALAMVADANANGAGFVPGSGDVVAVILCGDGLGPDPYQDTIIEVPVPPPPPDGEGCTPGFWRNPKRYDLWPMDPKTLFWYVFGVGPADPLSETIKLGGGGENALVRHATAGYLNALSGNVDYFYTPQQVIDIVQDAYASGDFTTAKDLLEAQNADDTVCPF